ncbi:MAG: hypothetical protein EXQ85_10065 [Alphaproteobacteria bacterium]|nr:hypothetical protein [Alphaproteobacteria bacterium]
MPIVERDPWRMQYFSGVPCPDELSIPTEDPDSYEMYPKHRWVYNKLLVCEFQGLLGAPHGVTPPGYPVFSKPIFNMRGMGAGSQVLHSAAEYARAHTPGHMWMQVLEGEHVSSDVAILGGRPVWWRHVIGKSIGNGMFDYWTVLAEARPDIESYCGNWLIKNLAGYSGMANFETIGKRIIEIHLRFSDQWPDLYGGRPWVESVVALYRTQEWPYVDDRRRTGYSVVLFGAHGIRYRVPDSVLIDDLLTVRAISSVQVTFHPDKAPEEHSMPPGGFRLAIVNCWELEAGLAAREQLALAFWSTQQLARRRRTRRKVDPAPWRVHGH